MNCLWRILWPISIWYSTFCQVLNRILNFDIINVIYLALISDEKWMFLEKIPLKANFNCPIVYPPYINCIKCNLNYSVNKWDSKISCEYYIIHNKNILIRQFMLCLIFQKYLEFNAALLMDVVTLRFSNWS